MKQALLHPSYFCHYTEFPGETQLSVSENSQQNHLPADAGLCALRCMVPRHELAQLLVGEDILPCIGLWVFGSAFPYFVLPTARQNPDLGGISRIFRYFPGMIRGKEGKTVTVPSRRKKTEKFQKNLIFPLAVFGKKGYSHTARNIRVIFQKKGVRS